MRIIAGSAKGRRLFSPQGTSRTIRPTADRAREALFNIIGSRVIDARVLDLFAGTGACGTEALSRGAAYVLFIDNSKVALDLVQKNISLVVDGRSRSELLKIDLSRPLDKVHRGLHENQPFDIVFADPPYLSGLSEKILLALDKSRVLSQNPLIIIEEQKTFSPPEKLKSLYLADSRKYGESSFFFYSYSKTSL